MTPSILQIVLTAISAASAVAAVFVTVTRDALRRWIRGPRLILRGGGGTIRAGRRPAGPVENANDPAWTTPNDVVCFDDTVAGNGRAVDPSYRECYLRLRVHVGPRRDTARGVRAFLHHVERPAASTRHAVPEYLMKWSGPLDAAEDVDIAAGTFRRLDVLRHRWTPATERVPEEPATERVPEELYLTPGLRREQNVGNGPAPSARNRLDQEGTYSLIIVLSAENARPTSWRFTFEHVGGPIEHTHELATCIRNPVVERLPKRWDIPPRPVGEAGEDGRPVGEPADAHQSSA